MELFSTLLSFVALVGMSLALQGASSNDPLDTSKVLALCGKALEDTLIKICTPFDGIRQEHYGRLKKRNGTSRKFLILHKSISQRT